MTTPGDPALHDRSDTTRDMLIREARTCPDPHVRGYSIYLLSARREPVLKGLFLEALSDSDKGVRAQAASALAGLGEDAVPDLIQLLQDDDWRIRYRSAEALGMIRSAYARDPLVQALSDQKDHVRYMAAKALGFLGDRYAVSGLVRLLPDENEYVRRIVVSALGAIGGDEAKTALATRLSAEPDNKVGDAIREVLEKG